MTKRLFWVALGAAAGVFAVSKAGKTLRKFTPSGLADSAGALPGALQDFADDVRMAAAEREMELYRVLGVDAKDAEG
jgi:gas vesicle protein